MSIFAAHPQTRPMSRCHFWAGAHRARRISFCSESKITFKVDVPPKWSLMNLSVRTISLSFSNLSRKLELIQTFPIPKIDMAIIIIVEIIVRYLYLMIKSENLALNWDAFWLSVFSFDFFHGFF